jgi:hypothetical protein
MGMIAAHKGALEMERSLSPAFHSREICIYG